MARPVWPQTRRDDLAAGPRMIPPTPIQAKVLDSIRTLTRAGVPPSHAELRDDLGISSPGALHSLLARMKDRGLVDYEHGRARSLRVVGEFAGVEGLSDAALLRLRERVRQIMRERGL